jgi:hypothetical protein
VICDAGHSLIAHLARLLIVAPLNGFAPIMMCSRLRCGSGLTLPASAGSSTTIEKKDTLSFGKSEDSRRGDGVWVAEEMAGSCSDLYWLSPLVRSSSVWSRAAKLRRQQQPLQAFLLYYINTHVPPPRRAHLEKFLEGEDAHHLLPIAPCSSSMLLYRPLAPG